MRVLVTRPEQDAHTFAEALAKRGHDSVLAPLLITRFTEQPPLNLEGVQALLATSANGVRAFAKTNAERALPLYAVGPQTAAAASELGFTKIEMGDGDAVALAHAVPRWAKTEGGTLLHVAGEGGEGRLKTMLEASGFVVRMEILYGIEAVESLPPHALSALGENRLDMVAVFSPRSASILAALIYKSGLEETCKRLVSVAISQRASDSLSALPFAERRIAARPNQDAMLAAIFD